MGHWAALGALLLSVSVAAESQIVVSKFLPVRPMARAQRPAEIAVVIENRGDAATTVNAKLIVPDGLQVAGGAAEQQVALGDADLSEARWSITANEAKAYDLRLEIRQGDTVAATASLTMSFLPPMEARKTTYVPEPKPVKTDLLIGAHNCPLWEAKRPEMWSQLLKHPERTPALGFYSQENPEVADWETKWATEHGVNFFIYCWYRAGQGGPVKMNFGSAIHDSLFKSKYGDQMKFTIMWENQSRGTAGVADEKDLMENLLPFWIDTYFKRSNYVKIDNKPLLFVYRPELLVEDLSGEANVVKAFGKMREACKAAGFDGLYLLGEYRGLDVKVFEQYKRLGIDYTFAYCWYVPDNPTPERAIATQIDYIRKTQALGILPQVATVSQAWSGWADEGTIWKIPPKDFETLLRKAKEVVRTFQPSEIGSRMLLLDNWNEWGEGHYIAPYREYGFGYLDAVRNVFAADAGPHADLLPEDVGMGPYDSAYQAYRERETEGSKQAARKAIKEGAVKEGLIAWWAFDEADDSPVALDYSGNRLGGILREAKRVKGLDGGALVCDGGCVKVASSPRFSPTDGLTIECWVKTDTAGQPNSWIVNRVYGGGAHTGYRLGVLEGKPCFEVPLTEWSHHLKANVDLPTGRWVHLAGAFDGKTMRIYVDGLEQGSLDRPGPINASEFPVTLGNYEVGHPAHFAGLLDEVRLYGRALSAEEVRKSAARP